MGKTGKLAAGLLLCAAFGGLLPAGGCRFALSAPGLSVLRSYAQTTVEYGNLRELLIAGNLDLQEATRSYTTSLSNYQDLLEKLREEHDNMSFYANQNREDEEAHATYAANASALSAAATQISKRIHSLTSQTGTVSVEKTIDTYELSAQSQMIAYCQMAQNVTAKEARVAAAERAYQTVQAKRAAGAATDTDVLQAADELAQENNLLISYRQQAERLRKSLLMMLGLPDDGSVTISAVPAPDLAAIDAIDFADDCRRAVGNDKNVQSARHKNASSMGAIERRFQAVAEAEGSAEADITDAYRQLLAQKETYLAALDAYENSLGSYQSLQRQAAAGMVSEGGRLAGEADYLEALAQKETASMALTQAYQNYLWEVKGVA